MSCRNMRELLSAHADGQATPGERRIAAAHLEDCPDCRRHLRMLAAMKAGVRRVPSPPIPADLKAALLRQARKARRRTLLERLGELLRPGPVGWGFATATAAAAVAVVVRLGAGGEELAVEELLAAHDEYALTMPLAPSERILSELPELMAGGADEP